MSLDELPLRTDAQVVGMAAVGAERRRLMDLGIVPGATIRAELTSPFGDPTAYLVRGGLLALRRNQARLITVAVPEELP
jgi:ferrous iron transport protein A